MNTKFLKVSLLVLPLLLVGFSANGSDQNLFYAIDAKDYARTKQLIEIGANVDARDAFGGTPLHYAADSKDIALLLIQNGANVNAKTGNGRTPLHEAAQENSKDTALLLIQNGANVDARDAFGRTPLLVAVRENSKDVALLLIKE